eukprot:10077971-Alexandrium_andersonii.AAC.1
MADCGLGRIAALTGLGQIAAYTLDTLRCKDPRQALERTIRPLGEAWAAASSALTMAPVTSTATG